MSIKTRFMDEPIWLMDGSAFVYRGFYANQAMTRSDGMPTGSLYVVARLLLRLVREEQPQRFAFVLDGRGKNFRHEAFAAYKANRDATPEGLIVQMEPIRRLVKALGLCLEISDQCEADDCIASLAARYRATHPVVIIGTDKDLRQCLHEQVMMWDPASRNEKIVTLDSFVAETGLTPAQWPDMQALVGDASDNIPGIPGIGPKTALKILADHPTLEAIRDGYESLPPTVQAKFTGRLDDMFLYRTLTTLRTNCCPSLTLEAMRLSPIDMDAASAVLREFELPSLERELVSMVRAGLLCAQRNGQAGTPCPPHNTTQTIANHTKPAAVQQFSLLDMSAATATPPDTAQDATTAAPASIQLAHCSDVADLPACVDADLVVLDLYDAATPGLIWAVGGHGMCYTGPVEALADLMLRARRIITADVKRLWHKHPTLRRVEVARWFDMGLAAYLINPEEGDVSWPRLLARFSGVTGTASGGAAEQAVAALTMARELTDSLHSAQLETLLQSMEMPLIPVLADMEQAGVQLDQAALAEFLHDVQGEIDRLTRAVYEAAGPEAGAFNLRSAQQLGVVLFETLGLPKSGKTRGGQARTDQEALEKLQGKHPIIDALLAYRKLEKMRSTYLEPLPRLMNADGRIRTTFNQTATATGRLSSSNPNLQNIPVRGELGRRMRACFTAAPGNRLVSADYSQIELRVLAHMSQEPTLLAAFRDGADIHARTASLLYNCDPASISKEQRRNAKTINFGLVYGMGPQSLAQSLGITLNEAKGFISQYFTHLSQLKRFYDSVDEQAKEQGFVTTLAGRRRLLPDIHSSNNQMRSQARRQAINTLVQGSAADIIKLAMLAVAQDADLHAAGARLLLQVHDELLLEAPEAAAPAVAARVAALMAAVHPGNHQLDVPLTADAGTGRHWGEAH